MRNTGGSGRSKSNKDKGSSKSQTQNTHTVKSEGPPLKTIQATAEQLALNNLIHGKEKDTEDTELKNKISQIVELTGCSQDRAEIALHDNQNDMDKAVNMVLEGNTDENEWKESGKKKKKQPKQEPIPPQDNHMDNKMDRRDHKDKTDKEVQDRDGEFDNYRGNRDQQDNYKRRRNDNKPPRLSRGRGRSDRPDRAGDRPEREDDRDFNRDRGDFNKDRGFERGRGRGRGASRRGGRGAGSGTGTFRPPISRFEKPTTFDNGPQIDTWTNETAVMGEKEPKISNWGDSKDDWNEDIDSWSGSVSTLAETKVFTASTTNPPEAQNPVQMPVENPLSNTFDLGVLYPKHPQNDISAEASYITQFNQQATESIKNSIGIGSRSSSLSSQTVSNVSALVSLQQNAVLHDNLGPSLNTNDLTANSLVGNGLGGSSLGTSGLRGSGLGSSGLGGSGLGTNDLGVANLGTNGLGGSNLGNSLSQSSMPGNSLTGNALDSSSLSVTSLTGVGLNGTGLANSLASVSQSINAASSIPSVSASQNALMQQRPKPQKSKCPPPSKIPASAVEMPGHMMAQLDVQFGNLEFGADSSPFSFGGNESVSSAYSTTASSSASTMNHANAQMGQDPLRAGNLEQNSPRNGSLYQPAYTTPTKQETAPDNNTGMSPSDSLQMHGTTSDLKSNQLMSNQSQQGSLPSTKIDSSLNSYSAGSYQSAGYQSHKPGVGYSSNTKPGTYQGNQFQTGSNPNQPNSAQYSSQYRQSNQNQFSSGANQYQSGSQYQSPPSGYQSQTGYQSSQTGYQSNQSQYPSNPNQFQNFQSGSTFQNQSSYPTNQSPQNSLYQVPSTSYSSQTQSNSLYSQSASHAGSYSNQSYLNRDHSGGAGSSYPAAVTQSSSPFKDNQSGASSYRENSSSSKTNESQSEPSVYSRDSQSASNYSDSQSVAYNRDSQSVGDSYSSRDSGSSSYKRETKSASGSYPRDSQTSVIENSAYNRDSQSSGGGSSFSTGRESQAYKDATSASGFRDAQAGSSTFSNQSNSYNREPTQSGLASGASQTQTGYSAKNFSRNSQDLTSSTLQTSPLTGSKLTDNFSKMAVKEQSVDSRTTVSSQFDVTTTSSSKSAASTTSVTPLTSSTTVTSTSAATTVTSSNTTKISTFPTISAASSKAPPNPPPGVQLMTQQYIMGQAGTLPFYGIQPPHYANLEELQYFQQRMPPLPTNNVYDFATAAAAAGLGMPPTTLTSNSNQQTMPNVPYSGTGDSTKMTRVEAQSPTGSIPTSQQSGTGQAHQQQPYFYSYIYPSSLIPGAGFQIPMIPMPQVTNAAHSGTPANSQYQQKSYSSHHVPYGTNKVYDDLTQQTPDFSKSPYGTAQTQPKPNSGVTTGSASSDIQVPGYGKTHAQAFDKQGFHASTPPPFNLQMAAGQLGSGTQAGPLGAPTGPYGAPYGVPMMTHQPHSQMLHHHLQDTSSSSRGSQQTGSHTQSKTTSKSYTGSNWGTY